MASDAPDYLVSLADFLCSVTLDELPDNVIERGRWSRAAASKLLDGLLAIDTILDMRSFAAEHGLSDRTFSSGP
jgi:hypothetical protein